MKYQLIEKLGEGGMAEVFRAQTEGANGFKKLVAIKRILPHLANKKDFIAMLSDEAKTVVRLTHANIVEVYDFEKEGDIYYLAMEFIDGTDLSTLIHKVCERGAVVPPDVAAWIIRDVARGLSYAHNREGEDGKPLKIVHRDISPGNILIARTGEVKLTDFGIAKALSNAHETETGILKGKLNYMSPEHALGLEIDGRSDIFSLGLVFCELLTGRKFFSGNSQTEILRQVQQKKIEETDLPREIPERLRKIIAKMLKHEAGERYQDTGEIEEALNAYIGLTAPGLTMGKIASFVKPFLPPPAVWRPFEAITSLMPEKYRGEANLVGKKATGMKKWLIALFATAAVIGDMIKPVIAPFSLLLMFASAAAAYGIFLYASKKLKGLNFEQKINSNIGAAGVFFSASFIIWGIVTLLQLVSPARGLIASAVPPVASLQDALATIAGRLSSIESKTSDIAKDVKDIKSAIQLLSNKENLIGSPSSPSEFYHNARVYQLRGLNQQALEAYKKFIEFAPDYVDAHLTAQIISRDTPGAPKLSGWYEGLRSKYPKDAVVLAASALLKTASERTGELESVYNANPENPVPSLLLANQYYEQGWVGKTSAYIRHMEELFKTVEKNLGHDKLQDYFIDKMMFEQQLEPMRAFARYTKSFGDKWKNQSLVIKTEDTDYGVSVTFVPQEASVKKILYSIDDPDPKKETGSSGFVNPATNEPQPELQLMLDIPDGKHTIYGRYVDGEGNFSEVASLAYEYKPFRIIARGMNLAHDKPTADMKIIFSPKKGKNFKSFKYSLNEPSLDEQTTVKEAVIKDVPIGSHILYVQGVGEDGAETSVFQFNIATK